ncbi:MAG: YoaK family protein [Kofleriaceae bacterium]
MYRERRDREVHHDRLLAGHLSLVAGWVNSSGFITIGTFTSHVTGNVGRLSSDLAQGQPAAAALAAAMVVAFFVGAFAASMALEHHPVERRTAVYGWLHLAEAALLVGFIVLATGGADDHSRLKDSRALVLCAAMGLQNSLVTRLSGAVVRTTHLTGVVTDLGIECARWFRHSRAALDRRWVTGAPAEPPSAPKLLLLLTIFAAFAVGSGLGAWTTLRLGGLALAVPVLLLVVGAGAALRTARAQP